MRYREASEGTGTTETKYDACTIRLTDVTYKGQPGSGRSKCFSVLRDGMTVAEYVAEAAQLGYDAKFSIDCLEKVISWAPEKQIFFLVPPEGTSLDDLRGKRRGRKAPDESTEAEAKPKKAKRSRGKKLIVDTNTNTLETEEVGEQVDEGQLYAPEGTEAEASGSKRKPRKAA